MKLEEVADCINENVTAVEAASVEYKKIDISIDSKEKQHIFNCFYLHDSTSGDINI